MKWTCLPLPTEITMSKVNVYNMDIIWRGESYSVSKVQCRKNLDSSRCWIRTPCSSCWWFCCGMKHLIIDGAGLNSHLLVIMPIANSVLNCASPCYSSVLIWFCYLFLIYNSSLGQADCLVQLMSIVCTRIAAGCDLSIINVLKKMSAPLNNSFLYTWFLQDLT